MKAYAVAASMTRFGKYPTKSAAELGREVVLSLLREVSLDAGNVDAVYVGRSFSGALDGQISVPGQVALHGTGIHDVPVFNIDNACAATPSALSIAAQTIRAGAIDIAIVLGMDKLYDPQRKRSMKALFGAMDVDEMAWMGRAIDEEPNVSSIFMDHYYARVARKYMAETGATERDYALVSVKNRRHAMRNPFAQYQKSLTEEDVLSSALVADPLRTLMCSPLTDGAAAILVCSEQARQRFRLPAIEIAATVVLAGNPTRDLSAPPALARAARKAFDTAGVGPADLDLVEVHDASAVAELIATEEIGIAANGEGLGLLRDGSSSLGGRVPVNVSGGLLSRGHPGAATGASQLVELVWQLQRRAEGRQVENARVGLAASSGGLVGDEPGATVVTILKKVT